MPLYFYVFTLAFIIMFMFMLIFLLSIWTLYFVLKTLIKDWTIKNVNEDLDLVTFPYAWSYEPLGLRIRDRYLGPWLVDFFKYSRYSAEILSEVLGIYSKALVILFMCRCYFELKRNSLCNEDLAQAFVCLIGIGNV